MCVDFNKLNTTTKDPYSLPFTNEVINTIIGHEVYTFLDKFSRYHSDINYTKRPTQNHLCDNLGGVYVGWKHITWEPLSALSHVYKYISTKLIAFNFGFHFLVFGLDILIFTKLMISNIIWKREINLKFLNSRNNECIYC
jgi:hypothetical protein